MAGGVGCSGGAGSREVPSCGGISGGDRGKVLPVLPMAGLSLGATAAALGRIQGSGGPNPLLPMAHFLNGSFYAQNALRNGVLRVVLSDCFCAFVTWKRGH